MWDEFISPDNFALALKRASAGRKARPTIARFMAGNPARQLESLRQMVAAGEFRTSPYRTMEITDPKRRTIYILPFYPDRIVHHALMNILGPYWESIFIRDSYACITGRGLHSASRRVMEFIRRNKFVLKCDIRKFYPSVNHDIMYAAVRRTVSDERILTILRNIIYSGGGGQNLPIGNLCSQWMGNLYMHELDIYIKNHLRVRHYIRYCDDFCIFSNDKSELAGMRENIRGFLADRLQLAFSKSEIFPISNGLDFLGYRHFPDFILLRKRTAKKIMKRMRRITYPTDRARGQVASANGWMKFACSYNLQKKMHFAGLKNMVGIK